MVSIASTAPDCHRLNWDHPSRLTTPNSPCKAPAAAMPAGSCEACPEVAAAAGLTDALAAVALPTTNTATTAAVPAVRCHSLVRVGLSTAGASFSGCSVIEMHFLFRQLPRCHCSCID